MHAPGGDAHLARAGWPAGCCLEAWLSPWRSAADRTRWHQSAAAATHAPAAPIPAAAARPDAALTHFSTMPLNPLLGILSLKVLQMLPRFHNWYSCMRTSTMAKDMTHRKAESSGLRSFPQHEAWLFATLQGRCCQCVRGTKHGIADSGKMTEETLGSSACRPAHLILEARSFHLGLGFAQATAHQGQGSCLPRVQRGSLLQLRHLLLGLHIRRCPSHHRSSL